MHTALTTLLDRLASPAISRSNVIRWGCPVPSFGNLSSCSVATLGLNPSNREFVDESGNELRGSLRRFPTLGSLGLDSWADVDARHLGTIISSCTDYFRGNPYDRWFRKLDHVISGTRASYYSPVRSACHLDLIPYATKQKWGELTPKQRSTLFDIAGDALGLLLRDAPVRILVLNGSSVVRYFQEISGVEMEPRQIRSWSLPRNQGMDVKGIAYRARTTSLAGVALRQELLVLGFNHNIQSSFGVTREVLQAIRSWLARASKGVTW